MLNEHPNQKLLRRHRLHSLGHNLMQTYNESGYNRLLYWGSYDERIVLFDLYNNNNNNPDNHSIHDEQLRNIKLQVDNGQFIKRFAECPIQQIGNTKEIFRHLMIGVKPTTPEYQCETTSKKVLRENGVWDYVEETAQVTDWELSEERVEACTPDEITLMDIFKAYIESNRSTTFIKHSSAYYKFSFMVPGTPGYCLDYNPSGTIRKLYIQHPDDREPTIQEVIKKYKCKREINPKTNEKGNCTESQLTAYNNEIGEISNVDPKNVEVR